MVLAESVNDAPVLKGNRWVSAPPSLALHDTHMLSYRYKVTVEVPVQKALFRVLPASLQQGKEIVVFVVLFTQGINEQQSIADKWVTPPTLSWLHPPLSCTGLVITRCRILSIPTAYSSWPRTVRNTRRALDHRVSLPSSLYSDVVDRTRPYIIIIQHSH